MTEEMSLTVFDPIKSQLAELAEKDSKLVFDHTTPGGEKELRSYVHRLRSHKTTIADLHKTTKRGALVFGQKVDAIKNELTAGVQAIIDARMKPLDDIEAEKRKAAEAVVEAERVAAEKAEQERLADLKKREDAVTAKESQIKADGEAAQRRHEERMAKIKRQEDEHATIVKAEADKVAAVDAAIEAEKEKAKVEAERVEAERVAEESRKQEEKEAADEAERKRVGDSKHREQVEGGVHYLINQIVDDFDTTSKILTAIKDGKIPHVTINY